MKNEGMTTAEINRKNSRAMEKSTALVHVHSKFRTNASIRDLRPCVRCRIGDFVTTSI